MNDIYQGLGLNEITEKDNWWQDDAAWEQVWQTVEGWNISDNWQKVWQGEVNKIESLRSLLPNILTHPPYDADVIGYLLNYMEEFAWQQANVFYFGFTGANLKPPKSIILDEVQLKQPFEFSSVNLGQIMG